MIRCVCVVRRAGCGFGLFVYGWRGGVVLTRAGIGAGEVFPDYAGYATQADRSDGVETDPVGESGLYGCGVSEVHHGHRDEDGE